MTTQLEVAPEPFDPRDLTDHLQVLVKELDGLDTDPIVRPIHDFLQDRLMPTMAKMQDEIATLTFYLAAHEDRISEIESAEQSQLAPDDADALKEYVVRSLAVLEQLQKDSTKPLPGLDELIAHGQAMVELIEEIAMSDPDNDPDQD